MKLAPAVFAFALSLGISSCSAAKASAPQKTAAPAASTTASPAATPAATKAAAAPTAAAESTWLVRDNGKRCIVAPCPSWTAASGETHETVEIAGIDLGALALGPKDVAAVRAKILSGALAVRGAVIVVPKMGPGGDGKVLKVSSTVTE